MSYINGLGKEESEQPNSSGESRDCFLCQAWESAPDANERRQRLIVKHDDRGLLLLNRYPYTNGHLLVAPRRHVGDISDLDRQERYGLMDLVAYANRLLQVAMNPQGMNVGMNIGRCAGAGLPGHVHIHIVPRWNGDVNYMQVIGGVRVIPQALEVCYEQLLGGIEKLQAADS